MKETISKILYCIHIAMVVILCINIVCGIWNLFPFVTAMKIGWTIFFVWVCVFGAYNLLEDSL